MTEQTRCPACHDRNSRKFVELLDVPTQDGRLWPTREAALASPTGDISLHFCDQCGHIFNSRFDPELLLFDASYDISLFHSPAYAAFVDDVIARLIQRYGLTGKTVLEVACGKADFLRRICRAGGNRGIGFDPTFVAESFDTVAENIEIHRRFFGPAEAKTTHADAVILRSALQYFTDPHGILADFKAVAAGRSDMAVYVEVPNALHTFAGGVIWNLVYEHGCFFSPASLGYLLARNGFDVRDIVPCFEEKQNLGIEATPAAGDRGDVRDLSRDVAEISAAVDAFAAERDRTLDHWGERIEAWSDAGKKVVPWGAGARAISLCTEYKIGDDEWPVVVDINPKRQEQFLPRTAQHVIAPEALAAEKPDVVLITNSSFEKEIRAHIARLGIDAEVVTL